MLQNVFTEELVIVTNFNSHIWCHNIWSSLPQTKVHTWSLSERSYALASASETAVLVALPPPLSSPAARLWRSWKAARSFSDDENGIR